MNLIVIPPDDAHLVGFFLARSLISLKIAVAKFNKQEFGFAAQSHRDRDKNGIYRITKKALEPDEKRAEIYGWFCENRPQVFTAL